MGVRGRKLGAGPPNSSETERLGRLRRCSSSSRSPEDENPGASSRTSAIAYGLDRFPRQHAASNFLPPSARTPTSPSTRLYEPTRPRGPHLYTFHCALSKMLSPLHIRQKYIQDYGVSSLEFSLCSHSRRPCRHLHCRFDFCFSIVQRQSEVLGRSTMGRTEWSMVLWISSQNRRGYEDKADGH